MNTLPRGKKILAMLNKDKKRFTPHNNKQKKKKSNNDLDPDYQPDSEDDFDSLQPKKMIQVHSHNRISGSNLLQVSSLLSASPQPGTSFQDLSNSENKIDIADAEAVQCSSFDNKKEESLPAAIASLIIKELIDLTISEILKKVTKKGTLRKRSKFDIPLSSRRAAKIIKRVLKHTIVKPPCSSKCVLKCSLKLNEEVRKVINQQYWESSSDIQKNFLLNNVNI
ncbi:unnamed protein product [Brassicogethes aeneus]|uniref:Uncharacterized protein n=1 Tax=Brassicogethes aeneus TaxID=1431903 RepID=A0A9P0APE5_BRAAE|nr:unnamed protein product [Brassicogethes aeneus]